jgi:hypothetical protein
MAMNAPIKVQATTKVKLQINISGAWRNVIEFDGADHQNAVMVMRHAPAIATLGKGTLRIVSADGSQTALFSWTSKQGWCDCETGRAV